jgi:uncharacterized protein YndB with AHSA1/START domain
MRAELTQVIDRPVAEVFRFIATDHVRNHPRWDPNMHLEQVTPGALDAGTVIRRRYRMGEREVEGEMEVVEFEPNRVFGLVIRDGPMEMRSRIRFEPEGEAGTRLTATLESDALVERMDPGPIQRSMDRMKELIESGG